MNQHLKIVALLFSIVSFSTSLKAQGILTPQVDRWGIQSDGSIKWEVNGRLPHKDHIEMAGEKVAIWVEYGLNKAGKSSIFRTVVFPTYRMLPDGTRTHISYSFTDNDLPRFYINNRLLKLDSAVN